MLDGHHEVPAIPGEAENALKLGVKGKGLS